MSIGEVALIAAAGFLAGTINAIVGAGSLITFPTLLLVGLAPVTANVTNTVGLVFGNVSAIVGYLRELNYQLKRAAGLSIPAVGGSVLGATLLLVLPQKVFGFIVPALYRIRGGPRPVTTLAFLAPDIRRQYPAVGESGSLLESF